MLKNIAVIAYHSSPLLEPGSGDSGGMTIYVRELAAAVARLGVRTDIFTRAQGSARRITELSNGVRVIAIEAGPDAPLQKEELSAHVDEFVAGVRAFSVTQRVAYDLVHSHYWQSGLVARSLADTWNVPLVHSHHTLGQVKNQTLAPGDVLEPPSRLSGEAAVNLAADVLIASTDDEWEHLSCLYGVSHDALKIIHPGVDHGLFHPGDRAAARAELDLDDELMVLYVGRIQPLKGLELAIRAIGELAGSMQKAVRFLVVGGASGRGGDGEITRLNRLVSDLHLGNVVRFEGAQPHDRLPIFYRAADALVVCSHSESFGLAALEAHACGTPVVGTAVGGLSYIVVDGVSGYLIDTRDPSVFARRLRAVLDPKASDGFHESASRSAATFSWDRCAAQFFQLYDCLVRERSPEACTC
ncbi:MAG: glycosyltransferase [Actinobacteria bacterium]|nr:glycosyltransferase [Actinomycetota bacterium]